MLGTKLKVILIKWELGPVHTNWIGTVVPTKVPIEARGVQFGCSK